MSEITFIWTGFGPFLDYDYNPSWQVAQSAARATAGQAHLLDVTFEAAEQTSAVWQVDGAGPAVVVHLGLAAGRETLSFERFAHNIRGDRDDLPDATSEDRDPLDNDGPLARETALMVGRLVDKYRAFREHGLPEARVSRDAGAYVCNATYYHSLAAYDDMHDVDIIFVHVPNLEPQVADRVGELLGQVFTAYFAR